MKLKIFAIVMAGLILPVVLFQVSMHRPEAPECPYIIAEPSANAGCMLIQDEKALLVLHRNSGKWDFPGGTSDSGESARCTAYRETVEETGFDVEVRDRIITFDNGYQLYRCTGAITDDMLIETNKRFHPERSEVALKPIRELKASDLRFPEEITLLEQAIEKE